MSKKELIKELEEIVSYFKEDGMYALKGLEDKINNLKNQNKEDDMRIECLIGETYQVTDGSTVWFQGRLSDCKAYLS